NKALGACRNKRVSGSVYRNGVSLITAGQTRFRRISEMVSYLHGRLLHDYSRLARPSLLRDGEHGGSAGNLTRDCGRIGGGDDILRYRNLGTALHAPVRRNSWNNFGREPRTVHNRNNSRAVPRHTDKIKSGRWVPSGKGSKCRSRSSLRR